MRTMSGSHRPYIQASARRNCTCPCQSALESGDHPAMPIQDGGWQCRLIALDLDTIACHVWRIQGALNFQKKSSAWTVLKHLECGLAHCECGLAHCRSTGAPRITANPGTHKIQKHCREMNVCFLMTSNMTSQGDQFIRSMLRKSKQHLSGCVSNTGVPSARQAATRLPPGCNCPWRQKIVCP